MSEASLQDRVLEIFKNSYSVFSDKILDSAWDEVHSAKEYTDDSGSWKAKESILPLIINLIDAQVDHPFMKWMIMHAGKSLASRQKNYYGLHILDKAIFAPISEDLLCLLTVRTIEQTAQNTSAYTYDLSKEAVNRGYKIELIAERYASHHKQFHNYLESNPDIKRSLESDGIDLSFWTTPLTYNDILNQISPPEQNKGIRSSINVRPQYKIHLPEAAPTIAEYKVKNVLQERLDQNVKSFLLRQQFDRVAAGLGADTKIERRHLMFSGPPGVGKTTLARVLGRHFKDIGMLKQGHVVETTATELIGQYVGHTAANVRKAVEAASGGILFIDEIYHFADDEKFGPDAVNQLLALMENERDSFILVVAGYEEDNKRFINLNPGMRDRFGKEFIFDHFSRTELGKILDINLKKRGLFIRPAAKTAMIDYLESDRHQNPQQYANARTLENLLENVITEHAVALGNRGMAIDFQDVTQNQRENVLTLTKKSVVSAIAKLRVIPNPKPAFGFAPL